MWKLACYPDRCTISDVEYILYDYNTRYMSALPALDRTEGGSAAGGNLAYTAPRQDATAGSAAATTTADPNVLSIHDAPSGKQWHELTYDEAKRYAQTVRARCGISQYDGSTHPSTDPSDRAASTHDRAAPDPATHIDLTDPATRLGPTTSDDTATTATTHIRPRVRVGTNLVSGSDNHRNRRRRQPHSRQR